MQIKARLVAAILVIALISTLAAVLASNVAAEPAGLTLGVQNHLDAPWTAWYKDTRANYGAEFHNTAMCPDGNVVAVGTSASQVAAPITGDLIVGKFDPDGNMLAGWPKLFTSPGYRFLEGQNVAVDAAGNIVVVGYGIANPVPNQLFFAVWKMNAAGTLLAGWPKFPFGNQAYGTGLALAANGDMYFCGGLGAPVVDALVLTKYNADGSAAPGWPKAFRVAPAQTTVAHGMTRDSDNNLVVAGYTVGAPNTHQAVLYKLDLAGNVLAGWPKTWTSGVGAYNDYFAVSQDPANGEYCVVGRYGGATNASGTPTDGKLMVTRWTKAGVQVAGWPKVYAHNSSRDNGIDSWGGSVDGAGNIAAAVTCQSDTSVHTVRYDRAGNMTESYPKILDRTGYHDETRGCAVDARGNVYTTGYSKSETNPAGDYSTFVAKYAPGPFVSYFAEGTTRKNATDGTFEEWLCLQNPGAVDANVTITYMLADGTTKEQKTVVTKATRKTINVNEAVGDNQDVSTKVSSDMPIVAERPMYFDYRSKWTGGHIVMGVDAPRTKWYFAEGTTRDNRNDGTYDEWLCMQNPGKDPADVTVTYMLETGKNVQATYTVQPTSRKTIDVGLAIGKDHDVSMVLNSTQPVVAERPMYFDYRDKWDGGHDVVASPGPDKTFYFAEGTTRDNAADGSYEEWICIQNPNDTPAAVHITYWTDQAGVQGQDVTVGANTRSTVDVKLKLGANVDTSFKITSDVPILVERPMYFAYHSVWDGGHNVMGCASPKQNFYFAEGNTLGDFVMYLAVLNPGATDATVKFTYMIEGQANKQVTRTLKPQKRFTLDVGGDVGANKNVSVLLESDKPIVAERPMYFDYHGWCTGGHDTLGLGI